MKKSITCLILDIPPTTLDPSPLPTMISLCKQYYVQRMVHFPDERIGVLLNGFDDTNVPGQFDGINKYKNINVGIEIEGVNSSAMSLLDEIGESDNTGNILSSLDVSHYMIDANFGLNRRQRFDKNSIIISSLDLLCGISIDGPINNTTQYPIRVPLHPRDFDTTYDDLITKLRVTKAVSSQQCISCVGLDFNSLSTLDYNATDSPVPSDDVLNEVSWAQVAGFSPEEIYHILYSYRDNNELTPQQEANDLHRRKVELVIRVLCSRTGGQVWSGNEFESYVTGPFAREKADMTRMSGFMYLGLDENTSPPTGADGLPVQDDSVPKALGFRNRIAVKVFTLTHEEKLDSMRKWNTNKDQGGIPLSEIPALLEGGVWKRAKATGSSASSSSSATDSGSSDAAPTIANKEVIKQERTYHDLAGNVVAPEDIVVGAQYGKGHYVPIPAEAAQLYKPHADKGIFWLRCIKSNDILPYMRISSVDLVIADPDCTASKYSLAALIQQLRSEKLVVLVENIKRTNSAPEIGVLFPFSSPSTSRLGFFYCQLPFFNDLRLITFGQSMMDLTNDDVDAYKQWANVTTKSLTSLVEWGIDQALLLNNNNNNAVKNEDGTTENSINPTFPFDIQQLRSIITTTLQLIISQQETVVRNKKLRVCHFQPTDLVNGYLRSVTQAAGVTISDVIPEHLWWDPGQNGGGGADSTDSWLRDMMSEAGVEENTTRLSSDEVNETPYPPYAYHMKTLTTGQTLINNIVDTLTISSDDDGIIYSEIYNPTIQRLYHTLMKRGLDSQYDPRESYEKFNSVFKYNHHDKLSTEQLQQCDDDITQYLLQYPVSKRMILKDDNGRKITHTNMTEIEVYTPHHDKNTSSTGINSTSSTNGSNKQDKNDPFYDDSTSDNTNNDDDLFTDMYGGLFGSTDVDQDIFHTTIPKIEQHDGNNNTIQSIDSLHSIDNNIDLLKIEAPSLGITITPTSRIIHSVGLFHPLQDAQTMIIQGSILEALSGLSLVIHTLASSQRSDDVRRVIQLVESLRELCEQHNQYDIYNNLITILLRMVSDTIKIKTQDNNIDNSIRLTLQQQIALLIYTRKETLGLLLPSHPSNKTTPWSCTCPECIKIKKQHDMLFLINQNNTNNDNIADKQQSLHNNNDNINDNDNGIDDEPDPMPDIFDEFAD